MAKDPTKVGGLLQFQETAGGSHATLGAAVEQPRSARDLANECSASLHRMTILSYVLGGLAFLVLLASIVLSILSNHA